MCSQECKGDQYRGCGHYVVSYYTGETYDCGQEDCKLSSAHMHKTAKSCFCNTTWREQRKVQNLFQWKCDDCKAVDEAERSAEFDRRTRRNW